MNDLLVIVEGNKLQGESLFALVVACSVCGHRRAWEITKPPPSDTNAVVQFSLDCLRRLARAEWTWDAAGAPICDLCR